MLLLMNSKNKVAKKDLRLAFAQGKHSAYPQTMEKMARFPPLQFKKKISTPTIILMTRRGIRMERRVMMPNWKIRIITTHVLQVRTSKKR